jgi:spore germination cell wall hydrolase CwlJ-like protein
MALGFVASLTYLTCASGAFGPAGDLPSMDASAPQIELAKASLSYSGADPVITGSVDHLFATASFMGPNRGEKSDRYRPAVDVLAVSRSFEEVRVRLAALRASPSDPTDLAQTRLADLDMPKAAETDSGPRMSVAAVDPSSINPAGINPATAAALDAIAGIAPQTASLGGSSTPLPAIASEQLAYARANAPVTGSYATGDAVAVSERELWCLATAIYFEARGESYRGQVAVAQVVMNRTKDHRYPDTICGVVFQNQHRKNSCQFSFACDGIPEVITERESWAQAEDIASQFTKGQLYLTEVGDSTHYHATYVRPAWAPRMEKVTQIGLHVFYKFKRGWLFG